MIKFEITVKKIDIQLPTTEDINGFTLHAPRVKLQFQDLRAERQNSLYIELITDRGTQVVQIKDAGRIYQNGFFPSESKFTSNPCTEIYTDHFVPLVDGQSRAILKDKDDLEGCVLHLPSLRISFEDWRGKRKDGNLLVILETNYGIKQFNITPDGSVIGENTRLKGDGPMWMDKVPEEEWKLK